ncbi:cofactor FMO1 FAD enzyme [Colletotrichum truncatum]|uniref:Cofactor FMO1 FAD enzyme n=1 Tax=Colletotrichum truncatum TaxID=5467 RepID=A0ACC3YD17_COLTU
MSEAAVQHVDVAIIGAGWYGLVAARTYLRLRPDINLLIVDSDSTVGGVWSKERLYPNLVAQVKLGLFNYSDTPMQPYGGDKNDPRVTGDMIHDYLHTYAEEHDLLRRIRFKTFVTNASQTTSGGWRLKLDKSDHVIEAAKLLVATGVTSIPFTPELRQSGDAIPRVHSRSLGTSFSAIQDPAVQSVVVVGAAKSAYDAVYLLLKMGKDVTWVIRSEGAGPLAILPFEILDTVNAIAFASTRLMTYLSPSILNADGAMARLFQGTWLGRWCVGRFWDFLDLVSQRHAGYGAGDHVEMLKPEIERQGVFWAHSGLGVVTLPDFWPTLHSKRLTVVRDELAETKDKTVLLKSGNTIEADYIISCTGWGDHFGMFDLHHKSKIGLPHPPSEALDGSGIVDWNLYDAAADEEVNIKLPFLANPPALAFEKPLSSAHQKKWRLYRRVVPVGMGDSGDRSVAILGQIHTVQTPLVSEVQSLWAILYLEGDIDLPDTKVMAKEVSLWNAWTRKRYLGQGQKFPYSLYDFLPVSLRLFELFYVCIFHFIEF